tara:strand:- start:7272 stop:7724 length:453 start_codon:yes stop_codon:yes gene_type:complete
MKLVIETQIRENYGAHDGTAENWKYKGGNTYEFALYEEATDELIAELYEAVTDYNDAFEEYVTTHFVCSSLKKTTPDYIDPYRLMKKLDGSWCAIQVADMGGNYKMRTEIRHLTGDMAGEQELSYLRDDNVVCDVWGNEIKPSLKVQSCV